MKKVLRLSVFISKETAGNFQALIFQRERPKNSPWVYRKPSLAKARPSMPSAGMFLSFPADCPQRVGTHVEPGSTLETLPHIGCELLFLVGSAGISALSDRRN